MKKLYFKVYQDRDYMHGRYFVETVENMINNSESWLKDSDGCRENPPVFEPVLLTEEEFKALPEFDGY